jgi:hypothetical protein
MDRLPLSPGSRQTLLPPEALHGLGLMGSNTAISADLGGTQQDEAGLSILRIIAQGGTVVDTGGGTLEHTPGARETPSLQARVGQVDACLGSLVQNKRLLIYPNHDLLAIR